MREENEAPGTTGQPARILVVDDEVVIRALLTEVLLEEHHEVTTADDGKQAIDLLQRSRYDLVITDLVMPGVNGIEVLIAAKRIDSRLPVLIITGYPSVDTAVRLVELGASDYITKPFNVDLIKVNVAKVLRMTRLEAEASGSVPSGPFAGGGGLSEPYGYDLFVRMLEKEIDRPKWRDYACSLLMAEIDNFGDLAESGKNSEAARALNKFSRVLTERSRPGDIIGHTDRSEFGLILPDTTRTAANALGTRICRRAGWNFTISAGLATYPRDASDAEGLIKKARDAVMGAESRGGDAVVLPI